MNKKNLFRWCTYAGCLMACFALHPGEADAFQGAVPDSLKGPHVTFEYDREATERRPEYRNFFGFYNSRGALIYKIYQKQLPERSPMRKMTLPYYESKTGGYILYSVQDSVLEFGYFDLKGAPLALKKQNCRLLDPHAPDSITRKTSKIFYMGRSHVGYSDKMLGVGSYFNWVDKDYNIIWTSTYLFIYRAGEQIEPPLDYLISRPYCVDPLISSDAKYCLLDCSTGAMYDIDDPNSEGGESIGLPLELMHLETGKSTRLGGPMESSPFIMFYKGYFHVFTSGKTLKKDLHIVVDAVNSKYYVKEVPRPKDGYTKSNVDALLADLKNYQAFLIDFK